MRLVARIGAALTIAAALVTGTTGTASAAPDDFSLSVRHSSGVEAAWFTGQLSWSTSQRTVMLTALYLAPRGTNECAMYTARGYQGSTAVTNSVQFGDCVNGPGDPGDWPPDAALTTTVPGGVQHVIIRLYDTSHDINSYANCYVTATTCQYG